jgi:hypothetical protein
VISQTADAQSKLAWEEQHFPQIDLTEVIEDSGAESRACSGNIGLETWKATVAAQEKVDMGTWREKNKKKECYEAEGLNNPRIAPEALKSIESTRPTTWNGHETYRTRTQQASDNDKEDIEIQQGEWIESFDKSPLGKETLGINVGRLDPNKIESELKSQKFARQPPSKNWAKNWGRRRLTTKIPKKYFQHTPNSRQT